MSAKALRWTTVSAIGVAAVVAGMVAAFAFFGWRQGGVLPWQAGDALESFRRLNPQLDAEVFPDPPGRQRAPGTLLRIADRESRESAVLRRDFVSGARVSFVGCGAGWPVPAGVREAACLRAAPAAGDSGDRTPVRWLAFAMADDSEATAAGLQAYFEAQDARSPDVTHALHRLGGGRWCVGLFERRVA